MKFSKSKKAKPSKQNTMKPVVGYQKVFFSMDFVLGGKPRFLFWNPDSPKNDSNSLDFRDGEMTINKRYSDPMPKVGTAVIELACSSTILPSGADELKVVKTRPLQIILGKCSHENCENTPVYLENSIHLGVLPTVKCEDHTIPSSISLLPYLNRGFTDAYGNHLVMGLSQDSVIKFQGIELFMNEFTPTKSYDSNETQNDSLDMNTINKVEEETVATTIEAHDDKSVKARPSSVRPITSSAEFINILNRIGKENQKELNGLHPTPA